MNYKVKDLADKCGVSVTSIHNFIKRPEYKERVKVVKGATLIPEDIAKAALDYFGIDEEIFTQEPEKTETKEEPQPTEQEIKIAFLEEQKASFDGQIDDLRQQLATLRDQLTEKDKQINFLLEQIKESQEQIKLALEQNTDLSKSNRALSEAHAVEVAAEKKEIILAESQEEKKPKEEKKGFWARLFG